MFRWEEFLALAEHLAVQSADETAQRTAISRAYYAAYHVAAEFVRVKGILRAAHSHRTVWGTLIADRDVDRSNVGLRGRWLKQARLLADYRNPFPGDLTKQVRESIDEAKAIVEELNRLT